MKKSIPVNSLFVIGLFLAFSITAMPQAQRPDLRTADWNDFSLRMPAKGAVKKEDVSLFIDSINKNDYLPSRTGDFVFVDLNRDGNSELVAAVDYSGRGFFNTIIVVRKAGDQFSSESISGWSINSLREALRDLDGDGSPEILVKQLLAPYAGIHAVPTWTAVYGIAESRFIDRSANFVSFYREEVLNKLDRQINSTRPPGAEVNIDPLLVERAKTLRVTKLDPEAGLELALRWSADSNTMRRIFAASILSELDGSSAKVAFQNLLNDADRDVSSAANLFMSKVKRN